MVVWPDDPPALLDELHAHVGVGRGAGDDGRLVLDKLPKVKLVVGMREQVDLVVDVDVDGGVVVDGREVLGPVEAAHVGACESKRLVYLVYWLYVPRAQILSRAFLNSFFSFF